MDDINNHNEYEMFFQYYVGIKPDRPGEKFRFINTETGRIYDNTLEVPVYVTPDYPAEDCETYQIIWPDVELCVVKETVITLYSIEVVE